MNLRVHDIGDCGSVQMMSAGVIKFDTENAATGVELCKLPKFIIVKDVHVKVKTAFDGTGSALSVGVGDDVNDLVAASAVTAGTAGVYHAQPFAHFNEPKTVKAKLAGTGATAGEAEIFLEVVRCPAE